MFAYCLQIYNIYQGDFIPKKMKYVRKKQWNKTFTNIMEVKYML